MAKRTIVIGLDGTPYSFVQAAMERGDLPNLARIIGQGDIAPMNSSYPAVSSVAWSCFMTGKNPGKHGIFGFVDRTPGTYKIFLPTSRNMQSETMWEYLSRVGKRVVVMNVPLSYPPRPVNGILVGCFLSPNLEKATYPPSLVPKLVEMGYRLDIDPIGARKSRETLLADFKQTLEARARTALHFMDTEPWDFFMLHVMETDRLHHFLWEAYDSQDPHYYPEFMRCYRQVDDFLGQVWQRIDDDTNLVLLSDHGFCTLKREVNVNYWLAEKGWLKFSKPNPESMADIDASSVAFSLDPGRLYVNLMGREALGSVAPGVEYEKVRDELAGALLELTDPDTGERVVERVVRREEVYSGPAAHNGADLIALPARGYDLKGGVNRRSLTSRDTLVGCHTFDDAFLYVKGRRLSRDRFSIIDVMPTILSAMNVDAPPDLDGRSVLLDNLEHHVEGFETA